MTCSLDFRKKVLTIRAQEGLRIEEVAMRFGVGKAKVVITDNAAFHKEKSMQGRLIEAGMILEYLPPYSPDLNPIEHKWA